MKKQDVVVGGKYMAKVSGGVVPVQVREERWIGEEHKGWIGVNTLTNRTVAINSSQRLQAAAKGDPKNMGDDAPGGDDAPKAISAARIPEPPKAGRQAGRRTKTAVKGSKVSTKTAASPPKAPKPKKEEEKFSGLDAAAKILAEAKKPMNCKMIVADAFKRNLWRSEGATPEATIYAAIIREISAKAGDARFKKVDRGQFAATKR